MDETGHISTFLVTNLIIILQWGNKGGEGEGEVYMYTRVTTCLNAKKGGETSKSKILRILKRGWPTCIKSKGDKIGMAWSRWLGDAVTYIAPLSRYTNEPYIVAEVSRT